MSRSAGTGSPVWFKCAKERSSPLDDRRIHAVVRTGKTKDRSATHAVGLRSMRISWEYRCSCGHVGWTNHIDILNRPFGAGADLSWRKLKERPYGKVELRDIEGNIYERDFGRQTMPSTAYRGMVEWRPVA